MVSCANSASDTLRPSLQDPNQLNSTAAENSDSALRQVGFVYSGSEGMEFKTRAIHTQAEGQQLLFLMLLIK